MQPETPTAEFQEILARAVRQGHADGLPPERLAVYTRLVRNNINSFIERCYPQAAAHTAAEQWAAAKEAFLRHGRAHSPYFQDIPGEFLDFCQSGANQPDTGFRLPESTLQLMRFEHSQLLAETAPAPLAFSFEWDEDTPFALSHTAQLGDYPFDVCADEPDPQSEAVSVLVWQDSSGSVYSRPIDAVDKILLQAAAESPLSQAQICRTLAEVTQTPAEQWQHQITDRWQQWIDEDILLPQNGSQP